MAHNDTQWMMECSAVHKQGACKAQDLASGLHWSCCEAPGLRLAVRLRHLPCACTTPAPIVGRSADCF